MDNGGARTLITHITGCEIRVRVQFYADPGTLPDAVGHHQAG